MINAQKIINNVLHNKTKKLVKDRYGRNDEVIGVGGNEYNEYKSVNPNSSVDDDIVAIKNIKQKKFPEITEGRI